jgi:hypothetical protein
MPYNLTPVTVAAGAVFPQSLSSSFVNTRQYPVLSTGYNDGTFERSLIVDTVNPPRALQTWALGQRLTTAQLNTLLQFWETTAKGGLNPFYFYDPVDVLEGQKIGSNWDGTGSNEQGRRRCFFRGDWSQQAQIARLATSLMIVEAWDGL